MEIYIEKDNKHINIDIQQSDSIYIVLSDNIYFIKEFAKTLIIDLNILCIRNDKRVVISKRLNNEKINEIGGIEALINECVDIINHTYKYINS
jgi:hypothetical protein